MNPGTQATREAVGLSVAAVAVAGAVAATLGAFGVPAAALLVASAIAGAGTAAAMAALVHRGRRVERRDTRWTALTSTSSMNARETLAAVERLTDPFAVERRLTQAMRELAPGARLELLRTRDAPSGVLAQARAADPVLVHATLEHGVVRRASTEATSDVGIAMDEVPADFALAVRYGAYVYGVLAIEGQVRGSDLLQLRRFADLLGFKLELHRVYAELAHREQLAALGAFAAGIAHDLRTPLSSIALSLQALDRNRDAIGRDVEFLEIAQHETDRLGVLATELLDYSRPIDLQPKNVDVSGVVTAVSRRCAHVARTADVRIETEVAASLPSLTADTTRLERVVENLLTNAIAVAPRGSDVRVRARATDTGIRIDVIDRGPGIPKSDHDKIFEPFFSKREGGTGLGLAIVRRIVLAHGGTIDVDSALGRGTKMSVHLPIRAEPRSIDPDR